jgi:uncharacterized protein (TIGR00375 family)
VADVEYIADLHLHSKYAAATSEQMDLIHMQQAAEEKGISIISTGDFTHPAWFSFLKQNLEQAERGLYKLKDTKSNVRFVIGVEVATIDAKGSKPKPFDRSGNTKRVHHCILAPSLEEAEQISDRLSKFGDLALDGRPMLSMSPAELVEQVKEASEKAIVFPAHAWTPWYGVFGSISGYDSMAEAYEEQVKHIHALETGLSSDPPMNWRVSANDPFALVSTSDAHSPQKIGREATVFELEPNELSFDAIASAIKEKRIKYTIEFYPEEGKYHYDGHRKCGISLSPEEAKKYNNICPVCGRPLTLGVLHRIDDLADRPAGFVPQGARPYVHAVPLAELIAKIIGKPESSASVVRLYAEFVKVFGSEFNVLLKASTEELGRLDKSVAAAVERVRKEQVHVKPGYDGVFGVVDIFGANGEEVSERKQTTISDF